MNNCDLSRYYIYSPAARLEDFENNQLNSQSVPTAFSASFDYLTENVTGSDLCRNRADLRNIQCFTIDCDDTKDMDDAVSLTRIDGGFALGVHIADVAAYITSGSELEAEAFHRGTTIYLPNKTIPMLPPELSENLCSLNPNEDRLTLSILVSLDEIGNVTSYQMQKTTIRSILKACYSEVNSILSGDSTPEIAVKYAAVTDTLFDMKKLASALREDRVRNGATVTSDEKPQITISGWDLDILPARRGEAECIIEEFMVLANRLVAEHFINNDLPMVHRAQTKKNTLAFYTADECQHASLALNHYAHFTSPIRRLADLKIHQVLTASLAGMDTQAIHTVFDESLKEAAEQAKRKKARADGIQKACTNYCYRLYFESRQDDDFTGVVLGRDKLNQPVIDLLPYHIRAPGHLTMRVFEGELISCKVEINTQNNRLKAVVQKRLPHSAA